MKCCNKVYRFCKTVKPCDRSELLALLKTVFTTEGSYIMKLFFLDTCIEYGFSISAGGDFTFSEDSPNQDLNENYFYTGQLFNLDDEIVQIAEGFDCFSFETKICF